MTTRSQRAVLSQLGIAKTLLLLVPVAHLGLLLPEAWIEPSLLLKSVWAGSTLLCIAGFLIANLHLGLIGGTSRLLTPTGSASLLLGGWLSGWLGFQLKYGLLLTLLLAFFLPFLNIAVAFGVVLAIRSSVSIHEADVRRAREADARRQEKFGPLTRNT